MIFKNNIKTAKFMKRPNRFNAHVLVDGKEEVVHVPNTGRCREILKEGATVVLREELNPSRKTRYDLMAVYKEEKLISIDSQVPNKVVREALENGVIPSLKVYNLIEREKTFGKSRFDFKLTNDNGEEYYLEVKGVTLEEDGHSMFPDAPTDRGRKHLLEFSGEARFPDAPTERGTKHVLELVEAKKQGKGDGILFLIQLEEVNNFRPNYEMDENFGKAVKFAKENGVDIFAYNCRVTEDSISIFKEVKVRV